MAMPGGKRRSRLWKMEERVWPDGKARRKRHPDPRPCAPQKLVLQQKIDAQTMTPIFGADGQPEKEWAFVRWTDFRIVYVFDISQTEGKEFPSYGVDELTGEVPQYAEFWRPLKSCPRCPLSSGAGSFQRLLQSLGAENLYQRGHEPGADPKDADP